MMFRSLDFLLDPVVFERSVPDSGVVSLADERWPAIGRGRPRLAVLIHGVACTWQFMRGLAGDLEHLTGPRGEPYYGPIALLAFDWRRGIEENADRLSRLLADAAPRVSSIDLYGYSQGGLLARALVERAGDQARALGLRHVFTFNAPHRGSPLANLPATRFATWGAGLLKKLAAWRCDGLRDLIPGSGFLKGLGRPPKGVAYTFLAGNSGWTFLRGLTQPVFGAVPNDGVASVDSQLHIADAGWTSDAASRVMRLIYPWQHFSLASGLGFLDASSTNGPLEAIAGRIAVSR